MSGPRATTTGAEEETFALGQAAAADFAPGTLVSLEGDLGAGKTVFVRGVAAACGLDPARITSPTFVLAIEHRDAAPPLLHVDLYRLPDGSGVDDLGIEDALAEGSIVLVEWGERLPAFLRAAAWRVVFRPGFEGGSDQRAVTILPPPR